MLEITLLARRPRPSDPQKMHVFQFENDELQAFLTDASTEECDCRLVSLRALGVPLTVTGDALKPAAKTAGPGAPRTPSPGINTPIQEQAREAGTLDTNNQPRKGLAARELGQAREAPLHTTHGVNIDDHSAKPTTSVKPEKK